MSKIKVPALKQHYDLDDTVGMRAFLIDCMRAITCGGLSEREALSVSRIAQQIYNTAKLEVMAARVGIEAIRPVKLK